MSSPARSGVFTEATDRLLVRFSESVSFDARLAAHDIAGSIAHAQMLAQVGLLTAAECADIERTLGEIGEEIAAGTFSFQEELEDVHMNIEAALTDRLGETGRKLHTARSRNDQVVTDLRLWCRDAIDQINARLHALQTAFVARCDGDMDVILPGYTHMQRAQPVLAPHYWLAYVEKFARDRSRLADCRRRLNACSLGAAALAGTSLPIDRHDVARRLGFDDVAANSLDISSDRDFVLEMAFALSVIATHLSTWAEEWILWNTAEFNYLTLPEQLCTGSSIMPQKINPDTCELIRGKSARVIGNLQAVLVLMKGLPMAYNRDLQEDKPRLFDSFDTVDACLEIAVALVAGAKLNRKAIAERLDRGYLDATSLMEFLIRSGVAQRTAHHLVGSLVGLAAERGVRLADLLLADFQAAEPSIDESVYNVLGVENAVAAFVSYGSTAPCEVRKQVEYWKERLKVASSS